ncbi:MAG TPA: group 1 truncated hemoglobin, partial [Phnomibacter sp.]|nr:group 1 truncated hemoglobin [Phnomibacter sp.]
MKATWLMVACAGIVLATACKKEKMQEPADDSLYGKLGGTTKVADPRNPGMMIEKGRLGLRSVVDSTIFVIAADAKLQP